MTGVNPGTYPGSMTNISARVRTQEAARLAGVDQRTIKRWAAAGRLTVVYGRVGDSRAVCALYDPEEIRAVTEARKAAGRGRRGTPNGCGHPGLCLRAECHPPEASDWSRIALN